MAVAGKCQRRGCVFTFDDADYMEDALSKLRVHYRIEHPTKFFDELKISRKIEVYNFTFDEALAHYLGHGWRDKLADGTYQSRNITHACQQICRYPRLYQENIIREVQALSAEHGRDIPDPFANIDANDRDELLDIPYLDADEEF